MSICTEYSLNTEKNNNNSIRLHKHVFDKTSHIITQLLLSLELEGEGAMGEDAGTLGSESHDSQLKENGRFMQAGQALINKTPWVAVYPAFFADLVNVYQTRVASEFSVRKKKKSLGWRQRENSRTHEDVARRWSCERAERTRPCGGHDNRL